MYHHRIFKVDSNPPKFGVYEIDFSDLNGEIPIKANILGKFVESPELCIAGLKAIIEDCEKHIGKIAIIVDQ